jgi:hypothetical protein
MAFTWIAAASFDELLRRKGFQMGVEGSEVIYEYGYEADPRFKVRIYTSLTVGAEHCRGVGEDAIRVCAIFVGAKTYGLGRTRRVNRTGKAERVLERMIDRANDMYRVIERAAAWGLCACGSPRWADSGRCASRCKDKHSHFCPSLTGYACECSAQYDN